MTAALEALTASVTVSMLRGDRTHKVNVVLDWGREDGEWWVMAIYPPDGLTLTLYEERRCCARAKRCFQMVLRGANAGETP